MTDIEDIFWWMYKSAMLWFILLLMTVGGSLAFFGVEAILGLPIPQLMFVGLLLGVIPISYVLIFSK